MKYPIILGVSILMGCFAGAEAEAASIAVANPSFETLPSGGLPGVCGVDCRYSTSDPEFPYDYAPIPGWSGTPGGDLGQLQPGILGGYFNSLPFGPTIAFSNSGTIYQTVSPLSQAGVTYTLSVWVGQRNDVYSPPIEELVVGSAITDATGTAPTQGNWSEFTATYTALTSGLPIQIDLVSTGQQGDWDNVQLTDNARGVPESSTWALMITGFLGLAGAALRRRSVGLGVARSTTRS